MKDTKNDLLLRVRKIEGQVRGIEKMLNEDKYCIDILNQFNAARRGLEKAALLLIKKHLHTCISDAILHKNGNSKIQELMNTLDQFLK